MAVVRGWCSSPNRSFSALEAIASDSSDTKPFRVLLTPQGKPLTQDSLRRFCQTRELVLVCGRYEGFDERIRSFVDAEVSLGDYVLNGGEVAAMAIIDGVSRLVPGVIGNPDSLSEESHDAGLLSYPQYTRPPEFRGERVPDVLRSGDHERISSWRRLQMLQRTRERRPDLWARFHPTERDEKLLATVAGTDGSRLAARQRLAANAYVALLHHPVLDRDGRIVTTALTNLDLHDIARSCRTYGLAGYFIVTPLESQQELATRILAHWRGGHGASYHRKRAEALALVSVVPDLEQTIGEVESRRGQRPSVVATSARKSSKSISYESFLEQVSPDRPLLILLGTGWGLTDAVLERADFLLGPVRGPSEYNHLSVRSAAAIILDRLFGMRE
jgi:tRNA (guanine37-N1)-methyltransferase